MVSFSIWYESIPSTARQSYVSEILETTSVTSLFCKILLATVLFLAPYFFTRSDESKSGFSAVVSSKEGVDCSTLFGVSKNYRVSNDGNVSIDVDAEIKLDNIAVLHDDVLLDRGEGSIVANAVVHIRLGWEGNTLRHILLFFVDFVSLLDDQVITILADLESCSADLCFLNESSKDPEIGLVEKWKKTIYRLAISPAILYFVTTKSLAIVISVSDSESDILM